MSCSEVKPASSINMSELKVFKYCRCLTFECSLCNILDCSVTNKIHNAPKRLRSCFITTSRQSNKGGKIKRKNNGNCLSLSLMSPHKVQCPHFQQTWISSCLYLIKIFKSGDNSHMIVVKNVWSTPAKIWICQNCGSKIYQFKFLSKTVSLQLKLWHCHIQELEHRKMSGLTKTRVFAVGN